MENKKNSLLNVVSIDGSVRNIGSYSDEIKLHTMERNEPFEIQPPKEMATKIEREKKMCKTASQHRKPKMSFRKEFFIACSKTRSTSTFTTIWFIVDTALPLRLNTIADVFGFTAKLRLLRCNKYQHNYVYVSRTGFRVQSAYHTYMQNVIGLKPSVSQI